MKKITFQMIEEAVILKEDAVGLKYALSMAKKFPNGHPMKSRWEAMAKNIMAKMTNSVK